MAGASVQQGRGSPCEALERPLDASWEGAVCGNGGLVGDPTGSRGQTLPPGTDAPTMRAPFPYPVGHRVSSEQEQTAECVGFFSRGRGARQDSRKVPEAAALRPAPGSCAPSVHPGFLVSFTRIGRAPGSPRTRGRLGGRARIGDAVQTPPGSVPERSPPPEGDCARILETPFLWPWRTQITDNGFV